MYEGDVVREVVDTVPQVKRTAMRLSDVANKFTFFNHGVVFGCGGFRDPDQDPIQMWRANQPDYPAYVRQPFHQRVVRGIPGNAWLGNTVEKPWDNVICGVSTDRWSDILAYMLDMVIRDMPRKFVARPIVQAWDTPDPSELVVTPATPQIRVYLFGLDSNIGRATWHCDEYGRMTLMRQPATRDALVFGEALLANVMTPLAERNDRVFLQKYREAVDALSAAGSVG